MKRKKQEKLDGLLEGVNFVDDRFESFMEFQKSIKVNEYNRR
jgi:hypothetical protein